MPYCKGKKKGAEKPAPFFVFFLECIEHFRDKKWYLALNIAKDDFFWHNICYYYEK